MTRGFRLLGGLPLLIIAMAVNSTALYADAQLAQISGNTDISIDMTTQINYSSVVLRVSGPNGYRYEQEFLDSPYIRGPLSDGLYKYEIYLTPAGGYNTTKYATPLSLTGETDENGRPISAGTTRYGTTSSFPNQRRGHVQSGTFSIENGSLVDPNEQEL